MLTFVIPLKSQTVSQSWEQVCKLFERCIRSICNQTVPEFQAIVVCNERPIINFDHPQITYLEVDFPYPSNQPHKIAQGLTDKGRKVLADFVAAQSFNPTHTMIVDADDCVSKRLAEYVKQDPLSPGWYINTGYKYIEGSPCVYIKRRNFYRVSGTCNIIRYDLNKLPENPEYNRGYGYYKFYLDHEKVRGTMAKQKTPMKSLSFPGAVYVIGTGDNMSGNEEKLSFNWINRKKIDSSLQDEFSLYSVA
jgi:glycosyltransferase involved in cell wall biosynthesis